ncbi:pimeloyl-CoA dehydrogenase small subunit [Mesorhizobium erdmanii]|uniref:Pimeloyl-CoA dehydrogenase small subunit n=2 Tax=Mesorhizobium TaxID=68287 RepID=A0A3M9X3Z9_9HYPH|nr:MULTISPECIES: acyl-CoA dehydrogenase family protein [Mesorhizobium]RNJ42774.1 pimeloyl-CoA dehydrogenase small subunit [Mesorhizobium japonicum]RXT42640.1 pimeloyl-CoA dehydrogenase small subunit [Mesorhizobium erdmanii]
MNFDLTEEQRLLKDSVQRLMQDKYGFEDRSGYQRQDCGYSESMWSSYAELGLLALPFPEEYGGFGGGAVETMVVMEAFGGALVLEPYFPTVVLAGGILRHGATDAQKAELIPAIAQGETSYAFGYLEPQSRYDLSNVQTEAKRDGGDWVLNGTKGLVLHGDRAGKIIVTARTAGGSRQAGGIGLFLLDANTPGVSRRGYPTHSGLRAADITLTDVRVDATNVIGDPSGGFSIISRVVSEAIAALCAEAVGAFGKMQSITLDYLKTREQFGKKIGSFQVLQHRAVDMLVELEQSRSMAMYAAMMVGKSDATERERATSAAKVQIGRSAKAIGHAAIQLHGGIAMTMDYSIGHYFRHVTMIDTLLGDADYHLTRLAELGATGGE